MNLTLTVHWVRRILYWGYARSDIFIFFCIFFRFFFYLVLWHHTGYALLYKDLSVYPHRCVAQQRVPPGCRAKIQTRNLPCGRLVRYQLSYATPPTELRHTPNRATPHPYWATPHPWLSYTTPLLRYATPLDIECALGQANFTLRVRPVWHNLYWGYAWSDEFYIEGTPVRQILHWGYARSDKFYTEGTPSFRGPENPPKNDVWVLQMDKILKKNNCRPGVLSIVAEPIFGYEISNISAKSKEKQKVFFIHTQGSWI